ncbi:hypothetical protein MNBD_PLANCTO03-546 [hydrothermal vent metagenome]|uniref:Uncharacterized protein n=1 Tax=hydrothermal vent metagenome TaxID=652676 RepID=A0A3B1DPI0_9ZZZZ
MRCGTSTADIWPRRCPATTRLNTALQHHSGAGVLRHGPCKHDVSARGLFRALCIHVFRTPTLRLCEAPDRAGGLLGALDPTLRLPAQPQCRRPAPDHGLTTGKRMTHDALMTLPLRLGIHRLAIDGECCSDASGLSTLEKHRRRQQPPHQPAARPQGGCGHDPELRIRDRQRLGWCRAVGGCNSGTGQRTYRK